MRVAAIIDGLTPMLLLQRNGLTNNGQVGEIIDATNYGLADD